ncbi:MAG: hypothetical protein KDH94_06140 [Coxiellaceae bacterium]|nr:hypothetical protein [Coxiellaceae bacterium]
MSQITRKFVIIPHEKAWIRETGVALLLKILALLVLWFVCFSHPPIKNLNDTGFANHVLSNPTTPTVNRGSTIHGRK